MGSRIKCPKCAREVALRSNGLLSRHAPVEGPNRQPGHDIHHPCQASGTDPASWVSGEHVPHPVEYDGPVHLYGSGWQEGRSRCGAAWVKRLGKLAFTTDLAHVTCRGCRRFVMIEEAKDARRL